jgi:isocitrate dehydrogenase kinase/phosphatase
MIQAIPTRNPETSKSTKSLLASELIGPYAITMDDGKIIYNELYPLLSSEYSVTLDFQGVTHFAAPFLNFAIGRLFEHFSAEEINTRLEILNISSVGQASLNRVIENSKAYYSDDGIRNAVNQVLADQAMRE